MLKKLTIRLNPKAVKSLKLYKLIYTKNNKYISYSRIINLLIYFKLPNIKISQTDLKYFENFKHKTDVLHSSKYYQNYTKILASLTNSINKLTRKFKGVANNINQLARKANQNQLNLPTLISELNSYKTDMVATLYLCYLLQKKVTKQWQM